MQLCMVDGGPINYRELREEHDRDSAKEWKSPECCCLLERRERGKEEKMDRCESQNSPPHLKNVGLTDRKSVV